MVFVAVLLNLLAGAEYFRLTQRRIRANPEMHLSLWLNTGRQITPAMTRIAAVAPVLVGAGTLVVLEELGWPGLLISVACFLPSCMLLLRHNKTIDSQKHS